MGTAPPIHGGMTAPANESIDSPPCRTGQLQLSHYGAESRYGFTQIKLHVNVLIVRPFIQSAMRSWMWQQWARGGFMGTQALIDALLVNIAPAVR